MKKRILPLLLAALLCISLFAGCQSADIKTHSGDSEDPVEEIPAAVMYDYRPVFESMTPETVLMTINGLDATWAEYIYWAQNNMGYLGHIDDWDAICAYDPSITNREFVMDGAEQVLTIYHVVEAKAKELGVELSEEDLAEIDAAWQSDAEYNGGEAAFIELLNEQAMSKELFYSFSKVNALFYILQDAIYGEQGVELSDEDISVKAEELGYMRAKHILIATMDETGQPIADDVKAEKLAFANDLIAQLRAEGSPEALEAKMDELMATYSEDYGGLSYVDGYTFLPGRMVPEFESAVLAAADYEVTEAVESTYGYHIILRLPLKRDAIVEYANDGTVNTLAYLIAQNLYSAAVDNWIVDANIEYTAAFESFDIAKAYSKAVIVETSTEE